MKRNVFLNILNDLYTYVIMFGNRLSKEVCFYFNCCYTIIVIMIWAVTTNS